MRKIRLPPQAQKAPRCASYSDEESVRRYEREVRVYRAHVEEYEIEPLEDGIDVPYRVQGSAGAYVVDIVDGSGGADACSCPDFLTNDLGTCKHLEAVRRGIQGSRALRAAFERLPAAPRRPTITVAAQHGLRLAQRGRWTKALLRQAGWSLRASGKLEPLVPEAFSSPPAAVRVVYAASPAHTRLAARAQLQARTERVRGAIVEGRLNLEQLAVPLAPFQREGVAHLVAQGRAMLADDVGLGKTLQALAACEVLCAHGEADRVLVVAPRSLVEFWAREVERATGKAPAIIADSGAQITSGARYKIASYDAVVRAPDAFSAIHPDVLVLDEAQRAKNFRARTAAALRVFSSRFVFALTGLPVDRHLDDLYALVQLVDAELLSPLWRFNFNYYEQDAAGAITGYKNLGALRAQLAPLLVRRRKEDVAPQLPPFTRQSRYTPLSPEQQQQSRSRLGDLAARLAQGAAGPDLARLLLDAHAACVDPSLLAPDDEHLPSPKLDELEPLIEEITQQGPHRVLLFSRHAPLLRKAAARLGRVGLGCLLLDRQQGETRRHVLGRQLSSGGEAVVVLLSDDAAPSIELSAILYAIHLDVPLGPEQLARRARVVQRAGARGLTEIFLCAEAGIERAIEASLLTRRAAPLAPLEAALASGRFDTEALALLRRHLQACLDDGAAPASQPPKTPPVAHLSLSPAPPPAAPAGPTVIEVGGHTPTPPAAAVAPVDEPAEPGPDTQRTRFQPGAAVPPPARAYERLRLARLALGGGFPCDAARAAHQALSVAIFTLLRRESASAPPSLVRDHAALVAAIFRVLLPAGKLPPAAHATLARLHDLAALDDDGVPLDAALARDAVDEAEAWIDRLLAPQG